MLIALVDTHIKVGEGEVFGPAPASIVLELKNLSIKNHSYVLHAFSCCFAKFDHTCLQNKRREKTGKQEVFLYYFSKTPTEKRTKSKNNFKKVSNFMFFHENMVI